MRDIHKRAKLHKEPKGIKADIRYRKYPRIIKAGRTTAYDLREDNRMSRFEIRSTNKALRINHKHNQMGPGYEEYSPGMYRRKEKMNIKNQSGMATDIIRDIMEGKIKASEAFKMQDEIEKAILYNNSEYFHKDNEIRKDDPLESAEAKKKAKLYTTEFLKQLSELNI